MAINYAQIVNVRWGAPSFLYDDDAAAAAAVQHISERMKMNYRPTMDDSAHYTQRMHKKMFVFRVFGTYGRT